jgi:molybdopterin-guanine dinucleotide biosynthesis protein A
MATVTEIRPCLGVLLAGGRSSRMGRDKALLDWHGQPLIERQLAALRASGVDEVRVSGARPAHGGIADIQPQLGPLGGLASVAATLEGAPELLVIPVDMPRLSGGLLRRLRRERPSARSLRLAGHVLPWRVRLDVACRATLATLLASDTPRRRSLHALQDALATDELPLTLDEAAQLVDCNTPERWREVAG